MRLRALTGVHKYMGRDATGHADGKTEKVLNVLTASSDFSGTLHRQEHTHSC